MHWLIAPARPRTSFRMFAVAGLLAALAACSDDDPAGPGGDDDAPVPEGRRLLVASPNSSQVPVVDLADGEVSHTLDLGLVPSNLNVSESGRYVFAVEYPGEEIPIIDAGVYDDPSNATAVIKEDPRVLPFELTGPVPTHVVSTGHWVGVHFDGSGDGVLLDERTLGNGTPTTLTIPSGAPHHGVLVPLGDVAIHTIPGATEADLPAGVTVRSTTTGEELQRFADQCPDLHGETHTQSGTVAFACADGILLLHPSDAGYTAEKVSYPSSVGAETRSWTLYGDETSDAIVVVMSQTVEPYGDVGFMRLDATSGVITEASVAGDLADYRNYAFTSDGALLVVLGKDGRLHLLDPVTFTSRGRVDGVVAAQDDTPVLVVGRSHAYVSDPANDQVVEVDLTTSRVTRRIDVGVTPGALALAGTDRDG